MRTVRRGIAAAALAVPIAFGTVGVAAAGDDGGRRIDFAEFEESVAFAGPHGAFAESVRSEAFSKDHHRRGHHRDHDRDHHRRGHHRDHDRDHHRRGHHRDHHRDHHKRDHHRKETFAHFSKSFAKADRHHAKAEHVESKAFTRR